MFAVVKCARPTESYMDPEPDQLQYDFNTTVKANCILGYNLTDGDEIRTCQHTADWDGFPPNCTSKYYYIFFCQVIRACSNYQE